MIEAVAIFLGGVVVTGIGAAIRGDWLGAKNATAVEERLNKRVDSIEERIDHRLERLETKVDELLARK